MTDVSTQQAKPRRIVSPELKAKMAAGRQRAAAERRIDREKDRARKLNHPNPMPAAAAGDIFEGMTMEDCADGCTPDCCVISGRNHCGHPNKGGIQAVLQMIPEVRSRYNQAKRHLKRLALDQQRE